MVQGINTGRYWKHTREYPIRKPKFKKLNYCVDCGKIIDKSATRCEPCSRIASRKAKRPPRNELKKMIRTMPFTKIGEKYNVSDNAIKKWCDAEKLPRTKKEIKKYTDL